MRGGVTILRRDAAVWGGVAEYIIKLRRRITSIGVVARPVSYAAAKAYVKAESSRRCQAAPGAS